MNSLTVWDDEAQEKSQTGELIVGVNRWSQDLVGYAIKKGMPEKTEHYTRRNDSGTGTIFEWN